MSEKRIPRGWEKVSKYAMKNGAWSLSIDVIGGRKQVSLYHGGGQHYVPPTFRGWADDGGYEAALQVVEKSQQEAA